MFHQRRPTLGRCDEFHDYMKRHLFVVVLLRLLITVFSGASPATFAVELIKRYAADQHNWCGLVGLFKSPHSARAPHLDTISGRWRPARCGVAADGADAPRHRELSGAARRCHARLVSATRPRPRRLSAALASVSG